MYLVAFTQIIIIVLNSNLKEDAFFLFCFIRKFYLKKKEEK